MGILKDMGYIFLKKEKGSSEFPNSVSHNWNGPKRPHIGVACFIINSLLILK